MYNASKTAATLLLGLSLLGLGGCEVYNSKSYTPDNSCEGLKTVIAEYPQGFAQLRGSGKVRRKLTLYNTSYQIVKGRCQIWSWDDGKSTYTCTTNLNSERQSIEQFREIQDTVEQCIDSRWQKTVAVSKEDENNEKIIYRQDDKLPAITLQRVKIDKLGRPQWALYLFVGDQNQRHD